MKRNNNEEIINQNGERNREMLNSAHRGEDFNWTKVVNELDKRGRH